MTPVTSGKFKTEFVPVEFTGRLTEGETF